MEEVHNNPNVILKLYKIKCKHFDKEEEHEYELPTPESLSKLCEPQIVKNLLTFHSEKYSSCIEGEILNLDDIESIQSIEMAKFLIMFLGFVNSKNDIYSLYDEDLQVPKEENYLDNTPNFLVYLNLCIDYLKSCNKFLNSLNDIDTFLKILSEIGITIAKEEKNDLFTKIKKDLFLSDEKNRILILLAPSNNFWIKSEKAQINDQNYDKKLNNHNNIFYNKPFIQKFLEKVVTNPRCTLGLVSSMNHKNLKSCWDALGKLDNHISELCPKNIIYIDQNLHDQVPQKEDKKNSFVRNMKKIIEHLKNSNTKNKDNEQINTAYFTEKNILILESEKDKMSESTTPNTIFLNIFNEEYLEKDQKAKTAIDLDADKFLQYLVKLLNNCGEDIRTYIKENPYLNN